MFSLACFSSEQEHLYLPSNRFGRGGLQCYPYIHSSDTAGVLPRDNNWRASREIGHQVGRECLHVFVAGGHLCYVHTAGLNPRFRFFAKI